MFIFSHAASGYIAGKVISRNKSLENHRQIFVGLVILFSLVPDLDSINALTVAGHHSIMHTPIFWTVITLFLWIIGRYFNSSKLKMISIGIFSGSMLHLVTDWIMARTVGIQWFYPFSEMHYYLYTIFPEQGQIPIIEMVQDPYFTFYMENTKLVALEIGINVLAVIFIATNLSVNYKRKI